MDQVLCNKCQKPFEKRDIIATFDGLFCSDCIPPDVPKKFFSVTISWSGVNAIIDMIDDNVNVDQLMILEKIKEKLQLKILEAIKEIMDGIPESDS